MINADKNLRPHENPTYFEEASIRQVWRELHTRFGFPVDPWKKRFSEYISERKIRDEVHGFYLFGNDVVNPVLNEILCRRKGHPTFQKMFEYVTKRGYV